MSIYGTDTGVTQVTVTVTVATGDQDKARATVTELIRRAREDFRPIMIPAPYVREALITGLANPTFNAPTPVDADNLPADPAPDMYGPDYVDEDGE